MPERFNPEIQTESEFDRMLRSSLESYAGAEADRGLAERILARVAAKGMRDKRRRLIGWAIALPVAACLVVAIALLATKFVHNSSDQTNQAHVSLPNPALPNRAGQQTGPASGTPANTTQRDDREQRPPRPAKVPAHFIDAAAARPEQLPKLDVFPSPQPLTPTEKEFIAYVARVPVAERKLLVEPEPQQEQQIAAPISIASLDIEPIEPPEPLGN